MAATVIEDSSAWRAKTYEGPNSTPSRDPLRRSLPPGRRVGDLEERRQWASSQIAIINRSTRNELAALDEVRRRQQEVYHERLSEKNELCQRSVEDRRAEAAELRSMISGLCAAISLARLQAKSQVDAARRRASADTKQLREQRQRQQERIAALTRTLDSERGQFEHDVEQIAVENQAADKRQHIARLRTALENVRKRLCERRARHDEKFNDHIKTIAQLREQLQKAREDENAKQMRLMEMRKICGSVAKQLSARKDEAASLERQSQMLEKDNEELEDEIARLEKSLEIHPSGFPKL
jgi:chromosome segregation ATPase